MAFPTSEDKICHTACAGRGKMRDRRIFAVTMAKSYRTKQLGKDVACGKGAIRRRDLGILCNDAIALSIGNCKK